MKKFSPILGIAIIVALTGCEPSELNPAGGIPFSGADSGGSQTAPQTAPQNLAPMMQDPEAQTDDWEEDIFANSQSEADSICTQKAENRSLSGGGAIHSRGAYQVKGKLYRCKFTSEVSNANDR
jgi:hypothetical protein